MFILSTFEEAGTQGGCEDLAMKEILIALLLTISKPDGNCYLCTLYVYYKYMLTYFLDPSKNAT